MGLRPMERLFGVIELGVGQEWRKLNHMPSSGSYDSVVISHGWGC